ncbi:eukaryotic type phosphoribosylformimino-5-aminoimidazole carboxamide ribotide isomerase [Baffinella frigidus]|nr:eukaryotic type phosphoribosylformimino-5-aminoimidazole carboxamide ribotide isomerase [Cryptophyta sp. CCMP2293]
MKFRPCIDLHNGVVKQLVGGSVQDESAEQPKENFASDKSATHYADMYSNDALTGGHVISIGAGNEEAAVAALKAYPGGLQYGGGVTPENARKWLSAGASHVIVTSYVFKDGKLDFDKLKEMVELVGKDNLVLDLSCRSKDGKFFVCTDRWQKFTDLEVSGDTLNMLAEYCDEFLVHAVDVEGKMQGIEDDLVQMLGECSPIPVTYAGGASTMGDLDKVKAIGDGKVDLTIGSGLDIFGGALSYEAVVAWQRKEEIMARKVPRNPKP